MSSTDRLNNYLNAQQPKQRYILYFAVVVLICLLGYILFLSDLTTQIENKNATIESKKIELAQLSKNTGAKQINILNRQIKQIKLSIDKKENEPVNDTAYSNRAPNLNITDGDFAKFLEQSMAFSKKLDVHLSSIQIVSQKLPYIGILEINKNLTIIGNGRFLDTLKLIRFMEKQKFLIKLKFLEIDKPTPPSKDDKGLKDYKIKNIDFKISFEVLGASFL